jgi:SagB-type dehydrogenase family enzyme
MTADAGEDLLNTRAIAGSEVRMRTFAALAFAALWVLVACGDRSPPRDLAVTPQERTVQLPQPALEGDVSVESALAQRRSIRDLRPDALTLDEVGQVLWAAQGITADWGGRTAPSAGATYPIELHIAVSSVEGLEPGVYRYRPDGHGLERTVEADIRAELAQTALGQAAVARAPVNIVIAAVEARTAERYGRRTERYVTLEAGHVAQSVALQAVALDLGSVPIGAFDDADIAHILQLSQSERPLYILPIGRPAASSQ